MFGISVLTPQWLFVPDRSCTVSKTNGAGERGGIRTAAGAHVRGGAAEQGRLRVLPVLPALLAGATQRHQDRGESHNTVNQNNAFEGAK